MSVRHLVLKISKRTCGAIWEGAGLNVKGGDRFPEGRRVKVGTAGLKKREGEGGGGMEGEMGEGAKGVVTLHSS